MKRLLEAGAATEGLSKVTGKLWIYLHALVLVYNPLICLKSEYIYFLMIHVRNINIVLYM